MLQTYVKVAEKKLGLIVLFQYGVFFQGDQLGCFCELGVLFFCRFCDEEPGPG